MIHIAVNSQSLSINAPLMVSGTKNYFSADFHFSKDWDGLIKTAYFKQGEMLIEAVLKDDKLAPGVFPDLEAGNWELSLWGTDADGKQRITTAPCVLHVEKYGGEL